MENQVQLFESSGAICFRDYTWERRGTPLSSRAVSLFCAITSIDRKSSAFRHGTVRDGKPLYTLADLSGASLWENTTREIPSWGFAWPVIGIEGAPVTGAPPGTSFSSSEVLPIYNKSYEPDTRFKPKKIRDYRGKSLMAGQVGLVIATTKESGEEDLILFKSGDQLIAANNRGLDYTDSTLVYDLIPVFGGSPRLSEEDKAPLHTAWRVMRPKIDNKKSFFGLSSRQEETPILAWQMGAPPYSKIGHGACVDLIHGGKESGTTQPGVGFASRNVWGPFFIGEAGKLDKHWIDQNGKGEDCYSLHFDCDRTMWKRSGGGFDFDAPVHFEGFYEKDDPLPYVKRGHLRYDPCKKHSWMDEEPEGLWRIQIESEIAGSDDVIPTPPTTTPSTGIPGIPSTLPPLAEGGGGGFGDIYGGIETPPPGESKVPEHKDCYDMLEERRRKEGLDHHPRIRRKMNGYYSSSRQKPTGNPVLDKESYRYIHYPFGVQELLGKPHPSKIGSYDIRDYTLTANERILSSYQQKAPITSRVIFFGGQKDFGGPVYTYRPTDKDARFRNGTGPGGVYFCHPELDIVDYRIFAETGTVPFQYTNGEHSILNVGIAPQANLHLGYIDPITGETSAGFQQGYDNSSDKMIFKYQKWGNSPSSISTWSASLFDFLLDLQSKNIKRGSGSPESVITGTIGDIYLRTDSPNGNIYFKKTGTNTDTGWIDIDAGLGGGSSVWTDSGAAGEVYYSNTDRDLVFGAVDAEVSSGNIYKTFFDISTGTFVSGRISTLMNIANRGSYSVAFGDRPSCDGDYSIVAGLQNTCDSDYSFCFGDNNDIDSTASHSGIGGDSNHIVPAYSYIFGLSNTILNSASHNFISGSACNFASTTNGFNYALGSDLDILNRGKYNLLHGSNCDIDNSALGMDYNVMIGSSNSTMTRATSCFLKGLSNSISESLYSFNFGSSNVIDQNDYSFAFGNSNSFEAGADYCFSLGRLAKPQFTGHIAHSTSSSGNAGDIQVGDTCLHGTISSPGSSTTLKINGGNFTLPNAERLFSLRIKVAVKSTSSSATNPSAIFVSDDEFDVLVTGGTGSIVGSGVINHYTNDTFASTPISVGYSISTRNVVVTVNKSTNDVVSISAHVKLVEVETV